MSCNSRGSERSKVSRRDVVKVALAAGVVAVAGAAHAEPQTSAAEGLTEAEVAAAAKVAGLSYNPKELAQMTGLTVEARKQITTMRVVDIEPDLDPAVQVTRVQMHNFQCVAFPWWRPGAAISVHAARKGS